jgi:hypothetical protein
MTFRSERFHWGDDGVFDWYPPVAKDVDYIQNPETGRLEGSHPQGGSDEEGAARPAAHRLTSDSIIQEAPAYKPNSRKVPEVARDLNERAGKILQEQLGVERITVETHDDRTDDYLAGVIAAELKSGLRNGHSSATWYSDTMKEAMKIAESIHPEIKTDTGKRWAFIASLAITSQGEVVDSNARLTEQVYKHFNETGKFPTDLKVAKPSINKNFEKLNDLITKGSVEEAREFLNEEFTVRELKQMGYRMGKMNMDDRVYGSAILGPKIGEGFYQNLHGNFKPLTMDMWFMRSWGRITNSGVGAKGEVPEETRERLEKALRADGRPVPRTNEKLAVVSREIFKQHERDYAKYRDEYKSGEREKSELVHAAERFHLRYDNGMIEAPRGGTDRNWMISVFSNALGKLAAQGINLTPAGAQATWWTPEKALYERLGARVREVETDYAKTLRKIAAAKT